MKWTKRIDAKTERVCPEAIESGAYVIARTRHSGVEMFTLWHGKERLGMYGTLPEAKQIAKQHSERTSA